MFINYDDVPYPAMAAISLHVWVFMHTPLHHIQALFKRMRPDASGRETDAACRSVFTNCQSSRTASIVLEYANNNTRWHKDFGGAFQILIENGYPRNHLVLAGQDLPILIDPDVEIPPTEHPASSINIVVASSIVVVVALLFGLFFLMIIVLH